MPRGSKESYTNKQKRQAHLIEESALEQGRSPKRASQIGWATVNKTTGGGKKHKASSGSKSKSKSASSSSSKSRSPSKTRKSRMMH